jgi:hypothetical protein
MRPRALTALVVLGLLLGGCGSEDDEPTEPAERQEETVDKLPKLPAGYEEYVNRDGGIAFGRPPGWAADAKGATTSLTAPDGLVSVSIAIDRTDDALALDPKDFAVQTAELVPGYKKPLEPRRAKRFKHEYEAAATQAKGVREDGGLRQRIRVVVLERSGLAVVTAVIAENAEEKAAALEAKQALDAIATLRTRPPV